MGDRARASFSFGNFNFSPQIVIGFIFLLNSIVVIFEQIFFQLLVGGMMRIFAVFMQATGYIKVSAVGDAIFYLSPINKNITYIITNVFKE